MKIVRLDDLKPGMQLAKPVYSTEGIVLLNAGVVLKEPYIYRLRELGFPAVYVGDPKSASSVPEAISDTTRYQAMNVLQETFTSVKIAGTLNIDPIIDVVNTIIDEVTINRDVAVHLTDIRRHDDYTFGHCVNVCLLSVVMGLALGFDQLKLQELAMGAILHDVGKVMIPDSILLKATRLNAEEWDEMKRHPRHGFNVLRRCPGIPARVAHVAYQHHERANGSGYPRGLDIDGIHPFAKIVAIADTYDAMTSDRIYRTGVSPFVALETIKELRRRQFDPAVADAFLASVVPYPPGCKVELTSGEVGTIVGSCDSNQPIVQIERDGNGQPLLAPKELSLSQHPEKQIARIV